MQNYNLKNGTTCSHVMKMPSEDDWWDFVAKVTVALNPKRALAYLQFLSRLGYTG